MINIESFGTKMTRTDSGHYGHKGLWISDREVKALERKFKERKPQLPISFLKEMRETFLVLSLIDKTGTAKRKADKINTILLGKLKNN